MSMLDITREELQKHNALSPSLNKHTQRIADAIPYDTVDPRMKAVIAISQISAFASQFKRNILLWDDTSVPINAISFIITNSGENKDSSVKAARKCFSSAYARIDAERTKLAHQKAIRAAEVAGEELPNEFEVYKAYLKPVPPIDIMPTSGPGLTQHINDIADLELSSGFLYAGEFSDELAYNQDMLDNIKILSEVYDTGDKEMKYTKGVEYRSKAIVSQPVSALFVGSPGYILYDESTRKKFHVAFMSKLARRSWFCYIPKKLPKPDFNSIDELYDYEEQLELKAKQTRAAMADFIDEVADFGLRTNNKHIAVPQEVFRLYKTYQRYNADLADEMPNSDSTSALIRRHLQWKALKLAGAFAIFDKSDSISVINYVDAIRLCELLSKDMELFEHDLNKATHERFCDYMHTLLQPNGKASLSIHDIKKHNFINSTSANKLKELVSLCNAYDTSGVYSIINDGTAIQYEQVLKTSTVKISFKPLDTAPIVEAALAGDKDRLDRAKRAAAAQSTHGLTNGETTFIDLQNLLKGHYAYAPFHYHDNHHDKSNLVNGTKFVVFDIDHSHITAEEAHFMLSDINHHITLGSNPNDHFKFRLLVELDSIVELSPREWPHFLRSIAAEFGLRIDAVPQSQLFFSYGHDFLLSVTDAAPLEVHSHLVYAKERALIVETPRKLTSTQQKLKLDDPLTTFAYCFECPLDGPGSRSMYRMIMEAKNDYNATKEQVIDLLHQVQDYWEQPLPEHRFTALLNQVDRIYQQST